MANTVPTFVGSPTFDAYPKAGALSLSYPLQVSDTDIGQTLTWTILAAPSHGILTISNATAPSGGTHIPAGGTTSYTPMSGYNGTDSFTVQVSDGIAASSITFTVNVIDDQTPPILSGVSSVRLSASSARIYVTSNEAGTVYHVLTTTPQTPTADMVINRQLSSTISYGMTSISANTPQTISLSSISSGKYYLYLAAMDRNLNASAVSSIEVNSSGAPIATTQTATGVSVDQATLTGSVADNGYSTTVTFQYGKTTGYGTTVTPSAGSTVAAGSGFVSTSAALTGLASNTTYHYRLVAVNSAGTTYGTDQTFTTTGTGMTDADAVAAAKEAISVGYSGGDTASSVTQNVTLSTTGTNGTSLTWTSNDASVIAANGAVTRPNYTFGDKTVTLTATISKGSAIAVKTFTLTVLRLVKTDTDAVEAARDALGVGYASGDSASSVTQNVALSTSGIEGTSVIWSASKNVILSDGTVIRPGYTEADESVTLTAMIMRGPAIAVKTFTLTVKKLEQTDADLVAEAKVALEVGYAVGDSASSVTQNVTLSTTGTNGTSVTWASNVGNVIGANGVVTRPSYTAGDAAVTLTATISKGAASDTKSFTVTVLKQAQTDEEAVEAARDAITIGYASGDDASNVTQNVTLDKAGINGTSISWITTNLGVIDMDGRVTRPSYSSGDATVELTALITKGSSSDGLTKTFYLTVKKLVQTDTEAVEAAKDAVEVGYSGADAATNVTQDVTLNTVGPEGTSVSWSSDKTGVIKANGTVTRPSYTSGDTTVTLTATIKKGSETATKSFILMVTKQAQTDTEAVEAAKAVLEVGFAGGDTATSVTQNVTLSTSGIDGTSILWTSNMDIIESDGTVTRPSYAESDASVTLTARITKGQAIAYTTFTLTVKKLAQTDAEAVEAAKSAVEVGYANGDSSTNVTQNVTLDTVGHDGTTVTWASDKGSFIGAIGAVTRPSYTEGDATVTLTATITKGTATATKTFTLTVKKLAQTDAEAVAAAKSAVEVGYANGDSSTNVTQNVTLGTTGIDGTSVTWSSDNTSVIVNNGSVTRPSYTAGDEIVTLTATIKKGSVEATKTFTLTVTKLAQTDAEAVAAAKAVVEVGYANGDSASDVKQNLTLGTAGIDGTSVTWSSDKTSIISNNGTVTRPSYTEGDAAVTLTATIKKGSVEATKTFTLTVTKLAQTDAEAVAAAKAVVEVGYANGDSASDVKQNLTLGTAGIDGTSVTWSSDKTSIISNNGTVTRPSYTEGDAAVTLTATIKKGSVEATKTFTLTVTKLAQTDAEAVAAAKAVVEVGYANGDSASDVKQNLTLGTAGIDGTSVTWSSDNTSVIVNNGSVTRPSYTAGDAIVTLTATIKKGSVEATKTFTLTVTKLVQTDAEAVAAAKAVVEVEYANGDSASDVKQNLTLGTAGIDGTSVTWSSDNTSVIVNNGSVTRPSYTAGDAIVTLTATIKKGSVEATKTFTLTVTKLAQTDAEAVAAAKAVVEVGYANGDSASDVKQNLTLGTAGIDGTSVTWSSDNTSVIVNNGSVTRPSYTAGDAIVTLTATIKKGSVEATKTFTLTVTKLAQTDAEAVAAAKAAVEVGYASGDSTSDVKQNLTLSTTGIDGTSITWSSDKTSIIATNGTVTRPSYTAGDATVTLTATIKKGSVTATKSFTLTVAKLDQTDAEAVEAAKAVVEVGYANGDSASDVKQNLTLSTTGIDGTSVTWSSDNTSVIVNNGSVTRPSYTAGDAIVTLTATIKKGSVEATKTFTLTVTKLAQTDAEAVAAAKAVVEVGYANGDSASDVKQNLTLSTAGIDGTSITWSTDKTSIIASNGTVTRPSYTAGDATVTLTATIKKGFVEETKIFTLTVTKLAQTDAEAVVAAKTVVEVGYANGDTAADVKQNLTLSTAGIDGTSITWSTDKTSIMASNGTVTRPSYTAGDATVTLTATIKKGSVEATKTFTLTVTKLAQTDAEAVAAAKAAVEVGYASGDSTSDVKQNLTLSTAGIDGTSITWSSDKTSIIANNGTVTRPSYTAGDAFVTLRATIKKGSVEETKTFTLTVTKRAQTDAEAVAAAKDVVTVGYATGDTATDVKKNLTLSTTGIDGTSITWSSDNASIIANNGTITRPSYTAGDATVILTATIKKGSVEATKTFTLTVPKLAQTDAEAVTEAKAAVEVVYANNETAVNVMQNVTLNTSGAEGTTVTWSSDKPNTIAADGKVTRPSYSSGDTTVTLTATITKGTASDAKTFVLTVPALPYVPTPSQPSEPTQPNESTDSGFEVWINGKAEKVGSIKKSERDNQSVLTVTLDEEKLTERLQTEQQHSIITIPVNDPADIIIGQWNGQMVRQMEEQQAVLVLQTEQASYTLPAAQIDIEAVAKLLGGSDLKRIELHVEIAKPSADTAKLVKEAAADRGFTLLLEPLQFTITATYDGRTIEVSRFERFVERSIAIPEGVDPSQITTAIVVEADGTTRHVPTKIVQQDGRYYAVVNSLTNSTYALISHSVQFKDVEGLAAQDAINDLGSRMIVQGSGSGLYEPRKSITRAEFIAIIVRALGLEQNNGASPFTDVKQSAWYNGAVNAAYAYHLIDGLGDGQFHAQDVITREQAMVIIARAMTLTKLTETIPAQSADTALQSYTDARNVSAWAEQSIILCLQAGLVNGKSSKLLAPKDNITKAEVAIIIERLLQQSELINK